MLNVVLQIALCIVGGLLVWQGSSWLEKASITLATRYGLPDVVTGAVVVAVGSSFPELSAAVLAPLIHGDFELGVAAIVGSALFNILVIPAVSGFYAESGSLETSRALVYKEAQFYIISIAVLLLAFSFAVIHFPVADSSAELVGNFTRPLALGTLAFYGVYIFAQYQDARDSTEEPDTDIGTTGAWLRLAGGLAFIVVGVEGLLRAAIEFGDILGTPSFFWGFSVVAAATSAPDALLSIRAAREGRSATSLANVMGSNVFDLLVCIPAGVLIAGAATVNYALAAPLLGILTVATLTLFVILRTDLEVTRRESMVLLGIYVAALTFVALDSFGAISVLNP